MRRSHLLRPHLLRSGLILIGLLSSGLVSFDLPGLGRLDAVAPARAADWITAPSYFTHHPSTGKRVVQFQPIGPVYTIAQPDYTRSVYRQTRSSIQVAGSSDNMHVVEQWGRPVRPYGEWRFPYRPYSVPYQAWGAPYAGLSSPYYPQASPYGGYGGYGPGRGGPNGSAQRPDPRAQPYRGGPYSRQNPPPYYDGSYPPYNNGAPGRRPAGPPPTRTGPRTPSARTPAAGAPGAGAPAAGRGQPAARRSRSRGNA